MFENLFNGFKKKYEEEIARAQEIEKEEENKRKAIIEELQERIKLIQAKYEEAGKAKIEKYKENETYAPRHLASSTSSASTSPTSSPPSRSPTPSSRRRPSRSRSR